MADLIDFKWHRDVEGYVIREEIPEPLPHGTPRTILSDHLQEPRRMVVGVSGKTEVYSPLSGNIALFQEIANCEPTETGIRLFAGRYGPLLEHDQSVEEWQSAIKRTRQTVKFAFAGDTKAFVKAWNREAHRLTRAHLRFTLGTRAPILRLVPRSLHDAAIIQLGYAVAGDQRMLVCHNCSQEFLVGTGTGRRETSRFCGTPCRKAWHRRHPA